MARRIGLLLLACLGVFQILFAQTRTVGKIMYEDGKAELGYTLFCPNQANKIFLLENCGLEVHQWTSNELPGMLAYLRTDGLLLRAGRDQNNGNFPGFGGNGGILELFDWNSNRVWEYKVSSDRLQQHHDIYPMPNGNILVLAWEKFDLNEAKIAGRDPNLLPDSEVWSEAVIELKPVFPDSAIVVWEWHMWDHLIQDHSNTRDNYGNVQDHPELMDLNYMGISGGLADWLHANSVSYNPVRDEIILSFRTTSEVVVVDHSTTTAEAKGHTGGNSGKGGDLIYRWGNPAAYRRPLPTGQRLFEQHNAHFVEAGLPNAGKIMIFNNGFNRNGYSTVEYVSPAYDSLGRYVIGSGAYELLSTQETFATLPGDTINSNIMGGAQQLPNGNILVTKAVEGTFLEFDTTGHKVWEYVSPVIALGFRLSQGTIVPTNPVAWANAVFRCHKYPTDYPGLAGRALPHGAPLETNPYPDSCFTPVGEPEAIAQKFEIYPNPAQSYLHIRSNTNLKTDWVLMDQTGRLCQTGLLRGFEATIALDQLPNGLYLLRIGRDHVQKVLIQRL